MRPVGPETEAFYAAVEESLVPPMSELGYQVCSRGGGLGSVPTAVVLELVPASRLGRLRSRLRRTRPHRLRRGGRTRVEAVGFEGPEGDEYDVEYWVYFYPESGELEITGWPEDDLTDSSAGVQERLRALGVRIRSGGLPRDR